MPYDTRLGTGLNTAKILESLTRARINNSGILEKSSFTKLLGIEPPEGLPEIYFVTEEWVNVEYFTQVIKKEHEWRKDEYIYFVDVRQQTSVGRDGMVRFKSSNDKMFTMFRVLLTVAWDKGNTAPFYQSIEGAGTIFCQWVVRAIGKTYPLNPATQVKLLILTGIFFESGFYSNDSVESLTNGDSRGLAVFAGHVAKMSKAPLEMVNDMIQRVGSYITNVEDFCKAIAEHSENVALENMTAARIYNSLSMTWFGTNSGEHAGVAIEYIPTFYAMILTALKDSSYRRTVIGEIVKDNINNSSVKLMLANFKRIANT